MKYTWKVVTVSTLANLLENKLQSMNDDGWEIFAVVERVATAWYAPVFVVVARKPKV